jgi:hypothetical protein
MKTKLEDKDFIIEIINKNRRNDGVSLNILTINSKMFDRSIAKDVRLKNIFVIRFINYSGSHVPFRVVVVH